MPSAKAPTSKPALVYPFYRVADEPITPQLRPNINKNRPAKKDQHRVRIWGSGFSPLRYLRQEDTMNTWTKLNDGTWGLRITETVREGDVVLVSKKAGPKSRETVGKIVWTGNGVTLAKLGPKPAKATPAPKAEIPAAPTFEYAEKEDDNDDSFVF